MYGVDGWQTDFYGEDAPYHFDTYHDELVLTYDATYSALYAGTKISRNFEKQGIELNVKLKLSPIATAKDLDDHVLRFKTAESELQNGLFYDFAGEIAYLFPFTIFNGRKIRFKIGGNIAHFELEGSQTQKFYGDDPGTPDEDETGMIIDGIPLNLKFDKSNIWTAINFEF